MEIILASASPRRRELLKSLGVEFNVIASTDKEVLNKEKSFYDQSMDIAYNKALSIYKHENDDVIVIGSDTMVLFNNKLYGKPKDFDDAFKMLKKFSNKTHQVITSLVMLIRKDGKEYVEKTYEVCNVTVSKLSNEEITNWINSNDVYSKAGAYAIQEGFGKYISKIEGDYYTIIGLPLNKTYNLLKKYGAL